MDNDELLKLEEELSATKAAKAADEEAEEEQVGGDEVLPVDGGE